MADNLKQLGRGLGKTQQTVEFLKRRGGLLPQVERTRGGLSTTDAMIAPFAANESNRKLSLSLNFFDKPAPVTGPCRPQAAQASYAPGAITFAVPTFNWETTPGATLIAIVTSEPSVGGSGADIPPQPVFTDTFGSFNVQSWTLIFWQAFYNNTTDLGNNPAIGLGVFTRVVGDSERTTQPTLCSPGVPSPFSLGIWLYETNSPAPVLIDTFQDTVLKDQTITIGGGSDLTIGCFAVQFVDYGNLPTMAGQGSSTTVTSADITNNPDIAHHSWAGPATYIGKNTAGGDVQMKIHSNDGSEPNNYGVVGCSFSLPLQTQFPSIPYPINRI